MRLSVYFPPGACTPCGFHLEAAVGTEGPALGAGLSLWESLAHVDSSQTLPRPQPLSKKTHQTLTPRSVL